MRICFVGTDTLRSFRKGSVCESGDVASKAELFLFGFRGIGEVNYEKELKGETNYFEDAALLSKARKAVVVCGCVTDTRGHKRKSALVAENGRLVGVSDMMNVVDGEIGCGAGLRVYETKLGRMGIVVAEDLNFPDVIRSLAVCGSDFIVCPFGRVTDSIQQVLLRADAYCYGVPIFFCADGYCMIAAPSGDIAFASPHSPVYTEFENVREYHLIETRRRGFFRASV